MLDGWLKHQFDTTHAFTAQSNYFINICGSQTSPMYGTEI